MVLCESERISWNVRKNSKENQIERERENRGQLFNSMIVIKLRKKKKNPRKSQLVSSNTKMRENYEKKMQIN